MTRLRVLVYPSTTALGGSSLNAIELAAAVRDRGHDVAVYGRDGVLVDKVRELGLDYIPARPARIPQEFTGRRAMAVPATAWDLRRVASSHGFDVLHGYEWPPIVEAYAAAQTSRRPVAVGTVMAMEFSTFIPSTIPVVVGTEQLRRDVGRTRPGPVHLVEPPVDTSSNHPGAVSPAGVARFAPAPGMLQIVVVSRLAVPMKSSGILAAVRAVGRLARSRPVRLVVVGDGEAYGRIAAAAYEVNAALGRQAVVLTGELADPRPAYASADICLGMGGSALRAMAFGKPLIVQGESGFFEPLTPATADLFLREGWYGIADLDPPAAERRLSHLLAELLDSPAKRAELGAFGSRLVRDRFSLEHAARTQEEIYLRATDSKPPPARRLLESASAGMVMTGFTARRVLGHARRRPASRDDTARSL